MTIVGLKISKRIILIFNRTFKLTIYRTANGICSLSMLLVNLVFVCLIVINKHHKRMFWSYLGGKIVIFHCCRGQTFIFDSDREPDTLHEENNSLSPMVIFRSVGTVREPRIVPAGR